MSQTRQNESEDIIMRSLGLVLERGHRIEDHEHSWTQLVYASTGVMVVDADLRRWVVPPQRGLLVPAGTRHDIGFATTTRMQTLYLRSFEPLVLENCRVINISPLLRELIREVVIRGLLLASNPVENAIRKLVVEQIERSEELPLMINLPRDLRARKLAETISEAPETRTSLLQLCRESGASVRTIERIFVRETGQSIGRWRTQIRLMYSIRLLASGESVTGAAYGCGYESTSAFVAAFKKEYGETPGQMTNRLG